MEYSFKLNEYHGFYKLINAVLVLLRRHLKSLHRFEHCSETESTAYLLFSICAILWTAQQRWSE